MIRGLTFTDGKMTISAHKLQESAYKFGIESFKIYREVDLDPFFVKIQSELFKEESRYGWYCWKPYIVLDAILKAGEGDILVYLDAGNELISDVRLTIGEMDQEIMFFSNGWQHSHWCKKEVAEAINSDWNGLHKQYFLNKQVQASTFFIKVTKETIDFVKEWYAYSLVPGLIDNVPRGEQFPEFQEHRWDQAILTCLQIKHGYRLHWFPSQTAFHIKAEYPNDRYPALVRHHRMRNSEY